MIIILIRKQKIYFFKDIFVKGRKLINHKTLMNTPTCIFVCDICQIKSSQVILSSRSKLLHIALIPMHN